MFIVSVKNNAKAPAERHVQRCLNFIFNIEHAAPNGAGVLILSSGYKHFAPLGLYPGDIDAS